MAQFKAPNQMPQGVELVNVSDAMNNVTKLLEENNAMDVQIDALNKQVQDLQQKKSENIDKISVNVKAVKSSVMVKPGDSVINIEVAARNSKEDVSTVCKLKEERLEIMKDVKTSGNNLKDHENLLLEMENRDGKDLKWRQQLKAVKKFRSLDRKYKEFKETRLKAIEQELMSLETENRNYEGEKRVKDRVVTVDEEVALPDDETEGSVLSQPRSGIKRKLDESVLDCGLIPKKISAREKLAMVPKVLKVEEDSPPNPHECNFCQRSFTSAAPLVVHLERHYSSNKEKLDCPDQSCSYTGNQENLTKHMRSKHTMEQLFMCPLCPSKFHTIVAKMNHEKRHSQPGWGQCDKEGCRKFYQLTRGVCTRCQKK